MAKLTTTMMKRIRNWKWPWVSRSKLDKACELHQITTKSLQARIKELESEIAPSLKTIAEKIVEVTADRSNQGGSIDLNLRFDAHMMDMAFPPSGSERELEYVGDYIGHLVTRELRNGNAWRAHKWQNVGHITPRYQPE